MAAFKMRKPCKAQGCGSYATRGGYCDKHRRERHRYDDRKNSTERGYDNRWHKVRAMKLNSYPLCERCLLRGHTTRATMVHHIVPIAEAPELRLDMDNLQSLCERCHDVIHSRHGNGCDVDGIPWKGWKA